MEDHARRALIRAALREVGYDAVGARTVEEARLRGASDPGRGRVRALVVDQDAVVDDRDDLTALVQSSGARVVLLGHATHDAPAGPWSRVIRRPLSIADVVSAVQVMIPLPEGERGPLDVGDGAEPND